MAPAREYNPVTGVKEPYFPKKDRLTRMFTASMVIIIMVSPPPSTCRPACPLLRWSVSPPGECDQPSQDVSVPLLASQVGVSP